jgi:hypothetical protein
LGKVPCPLHNNPKAVEKIRKYSFMAVIELLNYVICPILGKDYI